MTHNPYTNNPGQSPAPMTKHQKTVVITGCTPGGIGYACAHMVRDAGYRVIATARKPEALETLRNEGFETVELELADPESVRKAAEAIETLCDGRLYALFNNAAYGQPGAVEDLSREVFKAQFETNLFGTHDLTVRLLPMLIAAEDARIVQNSSVLGFVALRYRGAYNAGKYALEGLSDTLRLELEETGVKVSLIEPGPIRSRFRANALEKFLRNVDRRNSRLADVYEAKLAQLKSEADTPFTLPPEAVGEALLHALKSPRPKIRYRVTWPTKIFAFLHCGLPDRWMDAILKKLE